VKGILIGQEQRLLAVKELVLDGAKKQFERKLVSDLVDLGYGTPETMSLIWVGQRCDLYILGEFKQSWNFEAVNDNLEQFFKLTQL
jgi:uncharacterized protein YebE (UPF0316 family)